MPTNRPIPISNRIKNQVLSRPSQPPKSQRPTRTNFKLTRQHHLHKQHTNHQVPYRRTRTQPVNMQSRERVPRARIQQPMRMLQTQVQAASLCPGRTTPKVKTRRTEEAVVDGPVGRPHLIRRTLVTSRSLDFRLTTLIPPTGTVAGTTDAFVSQTAGLLLSSGVVLAGRRRATIASTVTVTRLAIGRNTTISGLLHGPSTSTSVVTKLQLASGSGRSTQWASLSTTLRGVQTAHTSGQFKQNNRLLRPTCRSSRASSNIMSRPHPSRHRERVG